MPRTVSIEDVCPSQLYLSSAKVGAVIEWFDFDHPDPIVLPVRDYDGDPYLTDGHTRAFVASLAGNEKLRVTRDETSFERTDLQVYHECLSWCSSAGITTISDLAGRVLSPKAYEKQWIERCHRVAEQFE
ncbi:hypothetical protein [Halocatena marina]|uniref:hypothetical protein n=1 Tax=Halocatena marina TaxID=2934937 RepID=UPI0020101199|nr:hypothetical protein [Halocatena marina]